MNVLFFSAMCFNITTISMTTLFLYKYYKNKNKYEYFKELLFTNDI